MDRTRVFALLHKLNIHNKANILKFRQAGKVEAGREDDFTDKFVEFLAALLNR